MVDTVTCCSIGLKEARHWFFKKLLGSLVRYPYIPRETSALQDPSGLFHPGVRYHTDFHPSNVLYDVKTGSLTIIDAWTWAGGIISRGAKGQNLQISRLGRWKNPTIFSIYFIFLEDGGQIWPAKKLMEIKPWDMFDRLRSKAMTHGTRSLGQTSRWSPSDLKHKCEGNIRLTPPCNSVIRMYIGWILTGVREVFPPPRKQLRCVFRHDYRKNPQEDPLSNQIWSFFVWEDGRIQSRAP